MRVQRGSLFRPETNYYKLAGIILLVASIQFFLAINLAETLFPGYNLSSYTLSDLASLGWGEPSATIFNTSIILFGLLSLVAVYLILKSGGCRLFSSCLIMASLGALGMGIFPEYAGEINLFLITFLFGSLAVLFSYRLGLNIPMVLLSMVLGSLVLIIILSLWWMDITNNPLVNYLGRGGTEKFIIYPIILYLTALGGYLTSRGEDWIRLRFFSSDK